MYSDISLLQSDQYEELMQESEEVKVRREETSEMLQVSNKQTCHTIFTTLHRHYKRHQIY